MTLWLLGLLCATAFSWYPEIPNDSLLPDQWQGTLVGRDGFCLVDKGDSLMEVARWEGLGYNNLLAANPGVDPWLPAAKTGLLLPYTTILPFEAQPGITINLAEFRLYLIWQHGDRLRVRVYPIGMGRQGWNTPEGDFHVKMVVEDPIWVRPESMRGDPDLPNVIAPGPDNPLGSHWIELTAEGYGIHGTNRPYGIGRRVSHGCIRLYPGDIIDLAKRVENGTPVRIIYEPIKLGQDNKRLFLEVHRDFLGRITDPRKVILETAKALGWQQIPDGPPLAELIEQARGVPVELTQP
ncbi:MAG: L,D-transpeptidase family protein [Desulfuromonadales bacterium]|nr:L,D-transpeptidase family protein [Desulfuromonadales bacterium]